MYAVWRDLSGGCKPVRCAGLATGREPVPATVDGQFAEHVATPATDGGVVPAAERGHTEIAETLGPSDD